MPSPDAVVSCADLRFRYLERFVALDGVSLDVERGTSVALLGANGCGKSTLLKVLDGLAFCEAGSYRAFGQEVTEQTIEDEEFARGFRTRVGFVFQSADAQVFSPTVRDEIAFGPLQLGIDADEAAGRVDDVLAMLGIARLAERAPHQLSGGEKKRVAIASVLVTNPEVLLFDEPTAGLDPRTQAWLLELLVELRAAGKTIVLATHDLDVLEAVCTRALVLGEDHRLLAEGTPADILGDRDLLLEANLVHDHRHAHREVVHDHEHGPGHHRRGHNGVPCSASSTSMAPFC
jgi:cobalt/nickel transport system ATP-binding protein